MFLEISIKRKLSRGQCRGFSLFCIGKSSTIEQTVHDLAGYTHCYHKTLYQIIRTCAIITWPIDGLIFFKCCLCLYRCPARMRQIMVTSMCQSQLNMKRLIIGICFIYTERDGRFLEKWMKRCLFVIVTWWW